MGILIYGNGLEKFEIDDRTLVHLQTVIITKLRRSESFALTLERGLEQGSGRNTLWVNPAVALDFRFHGNREPVLNRQWLEAMMNDASSSRGLHLIPEPTSGPSTVSAPEAPEPVKQTSTSTRIRTAPREPAYF